MDGAIDPRELSGLCVWPSEYQKLVASTMATLLWAGDALATKLTCQRTPIVSARSSVLNHEDEKAQENEEGEVVSAQTFLQDAFIEAFGCLADAVGHLEACVGFDPMNEPHWGLVNCKISPPGTMGLHIGHSPSLAQSLALGSGYAQKVPFFVKSWWYPTRKSHDSLVDPKGRSVWLPPSSTTDADAGAATASGTGMSRTKPPSSTRTTTLSATTGRAAKVRRSSGIATAL
ncbi:glycoside hydrolase superfamily [Apiospora arundinis]|uniref:Glycoside hydrolase superfamily n=1 Tax=Apiospora arundinis TaxID=335852 RepID=A0ABR2J362_9PEZI